MGAMAVSFEERVQRHLGRFRRKACNPDQARDEQGRWTSGGGAYPLSQHGSQLVFTHEQEHARLAEAEQNRHVRADTPDSRGGWHGERHYIIALAAHLANYHPDAGLNELQQRTWPMKATDLEPLHEAAHAHKSRVERHIKRLRRKAFNPDQPRDDHGRWTDDGGGATAPSGAGSQLKVGSLRPGESLSARLNRARNTILAASEPSGNPLDCNRSTINDPSLHDANGNWSPERQAQHAEILQELFNTPPPKGFAGIPAEHQAIIMAGLGGSGKGTLISSGILQEQLGINANEYAHVDPDAIKEMMAERNMIPIEGDLTPMECSPWAHEEASALAKDAAEQLQAQGKNVLWDITMQGETAGSKRLDSLSDPQKSPVDGYTTRNILMDVNIEKAAQQVISRYEYGMLHSPYGGRFITFDPEVNRDPNGEFNSVNARHFYGLNSDSKTTAWAAYGRDANDKLVLNGRGGSWPK
jgi:Zeta toxin